MKISVVVPTYNRADLLPASLDAILGQTAQPFEVIVVDDGSRDNTGEVLAAYAPRVRGIRIDNSGELVARNTGLRAASGDLVAFCDSDDLWTPDFLEAMTAAWRAEPGLRTAYCNFQVVRNDIWETGTKFDTAPAGYWDGLRGAGPDLVVFDEPIVERLIRFQPFFPSTMVVDRAHFLSIGGWDEASSRMIGCDLATTLQVAEHPPIGAIRRPLVGIRKHESNFSGDVQKMNLGDALVLELVLGRRPSLAPYRDLIEASAARRRLDAIGVAFARRDFAAVNDTYALLPAEARSGSVAVKHCVAALPVGLRDPVASALLGLGSWRSRRS